MSQESIEGLRANGYTEVEFNDLATCLEERERKIIWLRISDPGNTLKKVGSVMGVKTERARQLQNIALMKLRRAAERATRPQNDD